jgi:hypothetical protein
MSKVDKEKLLPQIRIEEVNQCNKEEVQVFLLLLGCDWDLN